MNNKADLLMWVGDSFYPTSGAFIKEGLAVGCSKRIAAIPDGVVPGLSRVFLAHDEGIGASRPYYCGGCKAMWTEVEAYQVNYGCCRCGKELEMRQAHIFGYFAISHVDVIIDDAVKAAELRAKYAQIDIRQVTTHEVRQEPLRGCGRRHPGLYLVSIVNDAAYMEKMVELARPLAGHVDIRGGLTVFLEPIPYYGEHFRGWRYMEPWMLEASGWEWPQAAMPVSHSVSIAK